MTPFDPFHAFVE